MKLPIFDHRHADCDNCDLKDLREKTCSRAIQPAAKKPFSGLMFVGEFPDASGFRQKQAMGGRHLDLLKGLCITAGIDIETCYITNALLCGPRIERGDKGGVEKKYPLAPYACSNRLLAEIDAVKPRVIVALGQTALTSLLGIEKIKQVRVPLPCPECDLLPKRSKKCPVCKGLKTQVAAKREFKTDARISFVSGGVYRREMLPIEFPEDHPLTYVIPTYTPSQLLRKAETDSEKSMYGQFFAPAVVKHLQKAKRLLTSDAVFPFDPVVTTDPEYFFQYTKADDVYAVDIETDSADPFDVTTIKCVGVGRLGSDEVVVVPTAGLPRDHELVRAVCAFFGDMFTEKVFQNGLYDTQVVRQVWQQETRGWTGDTLIAHAAVAPDEPHNLHHIAFTYTDAAPWKPPKNKNGMEVFADEDELLLYNARDVRATILAWAGLQRDMKLEGVSHIHDVDMAKARLAHEMTHNGMPIDLELREKIAESSLIDAAAAKARLRDFVREWGEAQGFEEEHASDTLRERVWDFQPTKADHITWSLFDPEGPLKLYSTKQTDKGGESTAKDAIKVYRDKPFVADILEYREKAKVRSTYIDGMPLGKDLRLHASWNPIGSRTGRWTSSPNFLNWPKNMRPMVGAPEGYDIVGADFDQLELRILAALSGDATMIDICANADDTRKLEPECDPHSRVAAMTFGKAFTDFDPYDPAHDKKNKHCSCGTCTRKALRDIIKRVVYGLNYGAQGPTIHASILDSDYSGPPLTMRIVEAAMRGYFDTFPGVEKYRDQIILQATEERMIACPLSGRRRVFPLGEISPTQVLNYPIQSCAASIVDGGLLALDEAMKATEHLEAYIFAMVHDAVYGLSHETSSDVLCTLIENTMRCSLSFHENVPDMPITITAQKAKNWKEAA